MFIVLFWTKNIVSITIYKSERDEYVGSYRSKDRV